MRSCDKLDLLKLGVVDHFDLYDLSQACLDAAEARAMELGVGDRISVHCEDFFGVDDGAYDLALFMSSLHHAMNVPSMVRQAHSLLKPGGILFADEYIGPARFAYPDDHLQIPRALYNVLAKPLRAEAAELPLPTPEEVELADPTESVQPQLIVESLRSTFNHVDVTPLFGALPFMIWWGLNHDALFDMPEGIELVRLILRLDEALYEARVLPSYFALLFAHD